MAKGGNTLKDAVRYKEHSLRCRLTREFISLIIFGILLTYGTLTTAGSVTECPVKAPCSCRSSAFGCTGLRLTTLPPLVSTNRTYDYITFSDNSITRVEDGYFSNLSVADRLTIILSYNRINYIGLRAFQGLENVTLHLSLENNDLVALPTALLELNQLQRLDISGIYSYDQTVMKHISKTLTEISVGQLTHWPQDLMLFLRHVKRLTLFELRMTKLSAENVTNFLLDFDSLSIRNSYFLEPLDGFCDIKRNYSLTLMALFAPAGVELVPNCQTPTSQIKRLSLNSIYVSNVSRILEGMPGLEDVLINNVDLRSLILPANNVIKHIALYHSPLEKFPISVGISGHLSSLSMEGSISSIKAEDLRNFPNLTTLDVEMSPVTTISENAFENNQVLNNLVLNWCKLTSIPKAVLHLPKLSYLSLDGNPIKCSCDMAWLLGWPRLWSVNISGYCMDSKAPLSIYTKHLGHCVNNPVIG